MPGHAKIQNSDAVHGKNKLITMSSKVLETGNRVKKHSSEEMQKKKKKEKL